MNRLRMGAGTLRAYLADIAIFAGVFMIYYFARTVAPEDVSLANANARWIIDVERTLGVFWEPAWQRAVLPHGWLVELANAVYVYLHLYFIPVIGFFVFLASRMRYRVLRNALLISLAIGLPLHLAVPTAPPRLVPELDVADTIDDFIRSNHYAAIPSFHYGWNAFIVFGVWQTWRRWWLTGLAMVFSALMWWSIVVTGNHYFFDMLLGALVMVPAYWLSVLLDQKLEEREGLGRFTFRVDGHRLPF